MSTEQRIEFEEEKPEPRTKKTVGGVKDILDGSILTSEIVAKQVPFLLFLALLAIFYIANRFNSEKVMRKSLILQAEVKELNAEVISATSQLMYMSKQSEVVKLLEEKGINIQEAVEPPKKIVINKRFK